MLMFDYWHDMHVASPSYDGPSPWPGVTFNSWHDMHVGSLSHDGYSASPG